MTNLNISFSNSIFIQYLVSWLMFLFVEAFLLLVVFPPHVLKHYACLGTNSIRRLILEIRSRNDREKKNERIVEETKRASELGQAKAKLGQGPSSPNSAKGRVPQFGQGPSSPARPRF